MMVAKNNLGQYMLIADEGMTLTNGEIYTKIYISNTAIDESAWTEVDDADVPVPDDEATTADYQAALGEMGVMLNGD